MAPPCPDALIGSMASIPAGRAPAAPAARLGHEQLADWTRERGVESWFFPWPGRGGKVVRVSAQLYNDASQYERLAQLLAEALDGG